MNAQDFLRSPRLPKTSPVLVLHLRADSDSDGNSRRGYAVLTPAGRLVEFVREDDGDDHRRRWPWFDHNAARALGLQTAYAVSVDVPVSEIKRFERAELDTESPDVVAARKLGDRAERYLAVRDALTTIRRTTAEQEWRAARALRQGRDNLYADTDNGATIYHRHPNDGGDATSDWLRRAMAAFVRAGLVERVTFDEKRTVVPAFFARSVGSYRSNESTPDLY